ncbi:MULTISPECIES: DapH/DapD/GlmU-related protein [Bacteroides]|mgnify:FL=1|jgi:acetyltransferase-like isoleucine patch superfamily enzyme|uniref:acyltransferase n=1 Tax=Bacteroides TaxID=816 RepID=UPI0021075F46|nr:MULTISPECIES: acyltransferase [Bacteroides]
MKRFLVYLGYLASFIYSPKVSWIVSFVRSLVYSGWKKRQFRRMEGFINFPIGTGGEKCISIGKGTVIGKYALITAWPEYKMQRENSKAYSPSIIIGDNCHIGEYTHITAITDITIGNNVLTGRYVLISDNSHGDRTNLDIAPKDRPLTTKGPIRIEDNVWIGDNVVILSGVCIGQGAVIGANSVVTKNVEAKTTVVGSPAQVISNR